MGLYLNQFQPKVIYNDGASNVSRVKVKVGDGTDRKQWD